MKTHPAQSGQGLVEYLMVVGLISVVAVGVVAVVGKNLTEQYQNLSHAITGTGGRATFTRPSADVLKARGMNDWDENARRADGGGGMGP